MLAIGVVFVLLLGEIDLSIGYVAGDRGARRCRAPAAGQRPPVPGPARDGARRRRRARESALAQGSIIAFVGVPSFVVTLAGFLIWQGVILNTLEQRGTIIIQDRWINYTDSYLFSHIAGWVIAFDLHRRSIR